MNFLVFAILFALSAIFTLRLFARLAGRRRNAKWRLSLRGLLGIVAVVAALFAGTIEYRQASMAQLRWIEPTSIEAEQLFPKANVTEDPDGRFEFVYYSRNLSVDKLVMRLNTIGNGGWSNGLGQEFVRVYDRNESTVREQLARLQTSDVLPDGSFVIRGRVMDQKGNSLGGAHVDILGRFPFINCFKTRHDGTFTMPLTETNAAVPSGDGYFFRVRTPEEKNHWHSSYFSLDLVKPERVVEIVVP